MKRIKLTREAVFGVLGIFGLVLALLTRFIGAPLPLITAIRGIGNSLGLAFSAKVAFHLLVLLWYGLGFFGVYLWLVRTGEKPERKAWETVITGPFARAMVALALVLLLGVLFDADGAFYKLATHRDGLRQASEFGILACGLTLVIIAGGIDLSVGSVLALSAVLFAILTIHWNWPAAVALLICVAVGASCGGVSGVLTAWLRIQPFIATLAMMVFARGLAKTISGGMKISTAVRNPDGTYRYVPIPKIFEAIDSRILWDNLSMVSVIFLVCALITGILLAWHRWGRELYAIGGNEEAARLSGISVGRAKVLAYVASGLLAAVAGICHAAQEKQGDPEAGAGYELTAIAMVVIGGTSLAGGRGGIGLTLIGTLTIGYLEKILSINAVPEAQRLMLTGVIIITAVLMQRRRTT
ncbi:MAG: ABC transporter permease [Thermoguttaceae bacterium]|nr:ABC transporter permease [Thermoguttaceae bacterium]MDW8078834.1 ABC transporter permease [Thermoguttaceae bacterium]